MKVLRPTKPLINTLTNKQCEKNDPIVMETYTKKFGLKSKLKGKKKQ